MNLQHGEGFMAGQFEQLSEERQRRIIEICREYEESRTDITPPAILQFLERVPDEERNEALLELVAIDVELRLAAHENVSVEDYVRQFPDHAELIGSTYQEVVQSLSADGTSRAATGTAQRLGGFVIVREIGRGGMGIIYEATQESLQRRVALKVLPKHSQLAGTTQQRFDREAKAIARLHHSHIVEVYKTGEQDGVRYFAMRLVDGEGLHRIIRQLRSARSEDDQSNGSPQTSHPTGTPVGTQSDDTPITEPATVQAGPRKSSHAESWRFSEVERWRFVARVGQQIAEALHYAHCEGVIHRDVKPSNIMLDARGEAWLTDFGLAKLAQDETGENLTEHGDVVGTLRYLAPEILQGHADSRSDVYSLGLTLFELVALRPAFDTTNRDALLSQRLTAEAPRLESVAPGLPRDLQTIIQKSIDREPSGRYQTASELADDLTRFLNDEPVHARRLSARETFWRWARRNKTLATSLLMTMTMLVVGIATSLSAAFYFQSLESQQRMLTQEKGQLAEKNSNLAASNAKLADVAQEERDRATAMVSDVLTEQGLRAVDDGRDPVALLLFAHAAAKTESFDTERTRKSLVRYHRLSGQMARPIAILNNETRIDRLFVHPSNRYVLVRPFTDYPTMIWDIATAEPVKLPPSLLSAHSLAWSLDGKLLAVGGESRVTLLPFPECLHSPSESELKALDIPALSGKVVRLEFDPSGRFLAMSAADFVRVWDLEDEGFVCPPLAHGALVAGVLFNPSLRQLVVFGKPQNFNVFELGESGTSPSSNSAPIVSGKHEFFWDGWNYCAPCLVRGGKGLLTSPSENSVQVWDLELRKAENELVLPGLSGAQKLEPLGDNEVFVVGERPRILSVAEPHQTQVRFDPSIVPRACMTAAYNPRRDQLFVGFMDQNNELWTVRPWRPLPYAATGTNGCISAWFSPDGSHLVTANLKGDILLLRMASTQDSHPIAEPSRTSSILSWKQGHPILQRDSHDFSVTLDAKVHHADFSADSRYLAVTSDKATAKVYDLQTRQLVGSLPPSPRSEFLSIVRPLFLSDSEQLAVDVRQTQTTRHLEVWNWRSGQRRQVLEWQIAEQGFAYLPQTKPTTQRQTLLVLTGARGASAFLFDLKTEGEITSKRIQDSSINRWQDISPDGRWVGGHLESNQNLAVLHNVDTDTRGQEFQHSSIYNVMCFSVDGTRLATSDRGASVSVWDATKGTKLIGPLPHSGMAEQLEFSSDGRYLLAISQDMTVSVWDLSTGRLAAPPFAGQVDVTATFRPGHDQVLILDRNGWFHVWDWKSSTRLWPSSRFYSGHGDLWSQVRTLTVTRDGHYAAVSGEGATNVIDLNALDAPDTALSKDLITEAELLSGHRLTENGVAVKLTAEEYLQRIKTMR